MAHKRANFSEHQKATLYVRDHATCAFSGLSLWLPDIGIRSNWEMDWADHIRPSARGGKADLSNGVCASSTFNAKKRGNGSDNVFFFHSGKITRDYVECFGTPSADVIEGLERRKNLELCDWYFNRAIANTFIALTWRCSVEFDTGIPLAKRDDTYWLKSAWKRHLSYQRKRPTLSYAERNLCPPKRPHGTAELLELQHVATESQLHDWANMIWPMYHASAVLFHEYDNANSIEHQIELVQKASENTLVSPDVVAALIALNSMNGTEEIDIEFNVAA